jgi:hypothetical protein
MKSRSRAVSNRRQALKHLPYQKSAVKPLVSAMGVYGALAIYRTFVIIYGVSRGTGIPTHPQTKGLSEHDKHSRNS